MLLFFFFFFFLRWVLFLFSQTYLEKYCSIIKENFGTYCDMITETASKKMDLECLLGVDDASLQTLCRRMGVLHDRDHRPDQESNDGSSILWLQMESHAAGKATIKECFVNLIHHMWLLAVQGPSQLHSENSAVFADRIYSWICRRYLPSQCVPSGMILMESFSSGATVRPHVCMVNKSAIMENNHLLYDDAKSFYIMRGKRDDAAWEKGQNLSEAPGFFGKYMLEDTMHMGPLDQQWHLFQNTGIPDHFSAVPGLIARAPELKPTRIYPIRRRDESPGTICIAPKGQSFVLINYNGEATAVAYDNWQRFLEADQVVVGPLVHRPNAVVRLDAGEAGEVLAVIVPRTDDPFEDLLPFATKLNNWDPAFKTVRMVCDDTYFLGTDGYYKVKVSEGATYDVQFDELDLVSVGTHIFVEIEIAAEIIGPARIPDTTTYSHLEGWLRYPDECSSTPSDPELIYVAIRTARGVEVHGFVTQVCKIVPPTGRDKIMQRLGA